MQINNTFRCTTRCFGLTEFCSRLNINAKDVWACQKLSRVFHLCENAYCLVENGASRARCSSSNLSRRRRKLPSRFFMRAVLRTLSRFFSMTASAASISFRCRRICCETIHPRFPFDSGSCRNPHFSTLTGTSGAPRRCPDFPDRKDSPSGPPLPLPDDGPIAAVLLGYFSIRLRAISSPFRLNFHAAPVDTCPRSNNQGRCRGDRAPQIVRRFQCPL